tara:strand:+ start:3254 stop:4102 length:849 start_codon:yes stop_codon:yes gene_type:complete
MNYSDITVGIVTFKSEKVIFQCLKSIKKIKKIIIFDNSNDVKLKKKVEKIYPKIKFILSKKNLGYGRANNKIIKYCKSNYLLILNPDTILKKDCEYELLKSINFKKSNFSIIAPIAKENNFGFFNKEKNIKGNNFFKVDYVKGFAMLLNNKKIKKVGLFDQKIFLFLEEIDLCRRLLINNEKIYINKLAKIQHLGAKSSNLGIEYEKCRNWHWMWSKFYYYKKYNGYFFSFIKNFPALCSSLSKYIIYKLLSNEKKKEIYKMRFLGLFNSYLLKMSTYRPPV